MAGLFGSISLLVIPETSPNKILQKRAYRLRHETKNWSLHAKADENPINLHTITHIYLMRPYVTERRISSMSETTANNHERWIMFVQEPILALMTAYMSYLYGVLYLLFEAVCS